MAARIARAGRETVYVETANDRSAVDVVDPKALGLLVDALKARESESSPGICQDSSNPRSTCGGPGRCSRSARRQEAALDGVALDIESLQPKSVGLRSARLLALGRMFRAEAGETPVAAIVYPSRGFERHPAWWPAFPWQELTSLVDAWIPMAYTGGGFRGYDATYGYVARSLRLLRASVGPEIPIHAAGGVANRMDADELKAFVDAVRDEGTVTGWSLYDFQTTGPKAWAALASFGAG